MSTFGLLAQISETLSLEILDCQVKSLFPCESRNMVDIFSFDIIHFRSNQTCSPNLFISKDLANLPIYLNARRQFLRKPFIILLAHSKGMKAESKPEKHGLSKDGWRSFFLITRHSPYCRSCSFSKTDWVKLISDQELGPKGWILVASNERTMSEMYRVRKSQLAHLSLLTLIPIWYNSTFLANFISRRFKLVNDGLQLPLKNYRLPFISG